MLVEMAEPTDTTVPYPLLAEERPFTVDDLDGMPDDGRRYELVDGMLFVSAAPGWLHQRAVLRLSVPLDQACTAGFEVLTAPFAVQFGARTQLQPDLLVTESRHFSVRGLYVPPLLAVEVLSESTRMYDRHTKRLVFQRAGTPSYWLVDPSRPSLTALELDAGSYVQVANVEGAQSWTAVRPYAVTVVPADLLR